MNIHKKFFSRGCSQLSSFLVFKDFDNIYNCHTSFFFFVVEWSLMIFKSMYIYEVCCAMHLCCIVYLCYRRFYLVIVNVVFWLNCKCMIMSTLAPWNTMSLFTKKDEFMVFIFWLVEIPCQKSFLPFLNFLNFFLEKIMHLHYYDGSCAYFLFSQIFIIM